MQQQQRKSMTSGLALALTLSIGALVFVAGCNIVAPAYLLVHGPEKIPQVYALDRERSVVFFLDDREFNIRRAPTRERVAAAAERALLDAKAVDRVLDSRAAMTVVSGEPRGDLLPISEVGRKVGAEVVIYVVPEIFTLSTDGQTFTPMARLRVKVLDAAADTRLWPEEREGYTLEVTATKRQGSLPTDASSIRQAENDFADLVGRRLAQLFYAHEADTVADERTR
ncbi:hypothetical protein MNBD_PLANCTO03-1262 [hydrothermal vent metagenome]|uniref:Lipoprotein n=1 Tax=hydrothermal vent metagenome TaxID=652676 RepID=A0A3B1E8U2_9ZZZZ